jgi:predicted small secreted protein
MTFHQCSRIHPDPVRVGGIDIEVLFDVGQGPVGGPDELEERISGIALMSGLSLAACSNTAAGAKKDAEINADKAAAAADKAKTRPGGGEEGGET